MSSPVTVSIDVPQPRSEVYAFLDVMANHESFTDHLLTNWRVSGPPTGVGAKAAVTVKAGGRSDEVTFELVPGREKPLVPLMRRMIRRGNERSMTRLAEQLAGVPSRA